ncbi:MAG: hypothetical protein A2580_08610 [Hydrogenophilales bacterium RIFOXYD1_FULL_62_11]|nr:MAG: hypothetical protein A2580_08610 [Hydrogenophilales bacterium RIFOXYD1_FULL_62_11]
MNFTASRRQRGFTDSRRQRGFTILELLAVLVIGIVVVALAAAGIGRAFASNEANTESRNINELITNIQTLKGRAGYPADIVPVLISSDGLPGNYVVDSGAVSNSWDGAVTVAGNGNSFTITYNNVPDPACMTIGTRLAEAAAVQVTVNATVLGPQNASADAAANCNADDSNVIVFTHNPPAAVT